MVPALLGMFGMGAAVEARAQEPAPAAAAPADGGVFVESVLVRGNRRIEAATVQSLAGLTVPGQLGERDVQTAIRRLMASGRFESVDVLAQPTPTDGITLIFEVVERPIVASVDFQGLQRISGRTVRDTIGWTPNQPLDPNRVARTERMIESLLARQGVQLRSIDTVLTEVPNVPGSFRLTFNVQEGERLAIADIEFRGNDAISSGALRSAMRTRPEGFLWFRTGRFDVDVFREDLAKRLPEFYGERGFIDFAVVSDSLVVDPQTGKARLIVEVSEGPRYRLGTFTVDGNSRFPTEALERMYTEQRQSVLGLPFGRTDTRERGHVFNRTALDAASTRVEQMYRNDGYLYAQVEPVVRRVPAAGGGEPTVDVTWAISERSPFFVNRVTIVGNTTTHESVIRDRIVVYPGDVYDEARLIQSYQAISALGFFETPMPMPDIRPNPETGEVDIVFTVQEKQTGSVNFGTAFGGYGGNAVSGFLGYSQPNLFGQGKRADLRAEYGWGRTSFQASYTDPAIFGGRNSASVSLFHTDDRYRGFSFSDGRYIRTGGSLQLGMPVPGMRWTRAFLGYSLSHYEYDAFNPEDCAVADNIFCQPSALSSNLSLSVARETKNHPLFPTSGTRQSFTVSQTGGVLGGSGDFQKVVGEAQWWVPVGQFGGGGAGGRPIRTALGFNSRIGTIFGDASRFPLERFFMGGTMRGEQLRGYDELEITPVGFALRGDQSIPDSRRLGDAFVSLSAEYAVRFTDQLSLSLFADAGNVWSDPRRVDLSRLFRGAGVGVTIVTPFGPLGLDYAYGFDRTNPQWKLHFKMSQ